ncbi:hemolysin secretion protein D [Rhodopseudomonas sp. AAP120]|jgi:membrane fusion protein, multidrug efflux system|uniref:efflux RND transporter periplasmic adaptor subunit n=1 Tax=Rhodopseudomonas sp. AAP120 TaxID=1523430 RepID=UPI0006B8FB7B|nr:efflux RND transporter periplasmic adaptor subunit [Rhodopseudomonas sp. AAP120]KPG01582.1 hemolysin secretion protein D [Rhodopseudomonas sp. AAP120]
MTVLRIAGVVVACVLVAGCGKKAEQPEPIRPVLSMVVAPLEATSLAVVGTVEPQFRTDYGFRMLGRLIARPVNVGDTVEKGQLLAAVDPFAAELAVRSALAELSTAQGQFANASNTANRQRTLIESGATTKATLDSAEQSSAAAQAAVTRAQSNLTKAREQLSYTKLEAEYAGVVTAVGVQVGQIVNPGQTVVTVARPDIREAVIDVADELAGMLKIGTPLTVRLQLDQRIQAAGKVREVAPQADAVTRTRRVRITLEAPPDTFRLGSTITTLIPDKPRRGYPLPATAILTENGQSSVWVIDPATKSVSKRKVQVVRDDDNSVEVTDGIKAGERVARAGVHQLKEGQRVRLEGEPQA